MTWVSYEFKGACGNDHKYQLDIQINHAQRAGTYRQGECSIYVVPQMKNVALQIDNGLRSHTHAVTSSVEAFTKLLQRTGRTSIAKRFGTF